MAADRQGRLDVQELERHNEAIRRLARSLVAGDDDADEVIQRTIVVALTTAPKDGSRPLAWLYGVMKNIARSLRRSDVRRERRELVAARAEAVPSVLEDAAEIDARLRLWAHVRALGEPYRTVIRLRFADNLTPAEIAVSLGIPVATVKTQLRRGLERLRSHLDESHQGRREAWLLVIAPEAPKAPRPTPTHLATATLATGLAVAACVGLIVVLPRADRDDDAPGLVGGTPLSGPELAAGAASSRTTPVSPDPAGPSVAHPAPGSVPTREVPVRIDRSAVPGARDVRVRLRDRAGAERSAPLGDDGFARFPDVPDGAYVVWAERHANCTTFLEWLAVPWAPERPPALPLIPVATLTGVVVREGTREPVRGARVVVAATDQAVSSPEWQATTGADGAFEIGSVPAQRARFIEGLQIAVSAEGFVIARRPLPFRGTDPTTAYTADFALKPGVSARGVILDAHGAPAVGVVVHAVVDPESLGPPSPRRVRPFDLSHWTEFQAVVGETFVAFDEESQFDTPRYDEPPVCATRTDATGAFSLHGLQAGLRYAFCATRDRELSPWVDVVAALPSVTVPTIRLDGFGALRLVVRDAQRGPVAGLESKYVDFEAPAPGLLRFPRLRSGAQKVDVIAPGFARRRLDLEIPADDTLELEVTLDPEVPIRGTVVDQLGRPLAHTGLGFLTGFNRPGSTILEEDHVETGPDGTFVIRGLPAGRHLVYLRDVNGQLHQEVAVTPGDPIRLVEPTLAAGRAAVTLALPAGVAAPESVYVGVHDGRRPTSVRRREFLRRYMADRWGGLSFMSDRPWNGGRIEFAIRPTDTEMVIVVEGCAPVYLPLTPASASPQKVALDRGVTVRGRLLDRAGQPVSPGCVAVGTFPTDWMVVKTNAAGYFVLEHVPPGPTVLLAHGEGHVDTEVDVIAGASTSDLTITLERGTRVTGAVVEHLRGSTVENPRVRFFRAGDAAATPIEEVEVGAIGTFALDLLPGSYRVVATQADREAETTLEVGTAPSPALELTLRTRAK